MPSDYSRQMLLREVGAEGQAKLGRSRVLVIGAGGLGSPVLQYLTGAGIGCIGIVDADVLDPSNLHRQPLYSLDDVGRPKAGLAAAALRNINPSVLIETHAIRFDADNALDLVRRYDLVIDCSDNFRTKFLINDAAVLAKKPAVFASVYQYEGQLQVYAPDDGHACLRCLWPQASDDGVVGNCAEAGVLGPVPGAFGAMQALLALKILLNIAGRLENELLLMDFMNFSTVKLKAPRRAGCRAPDCGLVRPPAGEEADLEVRLANLAEALARGMQVIDIRSDEEVAATLAAGRHIPMSALLADPGLLSPAGCYLLVCASGQRSLAAARALRAAGIRAQSLAYGLKGLDETD